MSKEIVEVIDNNESIEIIDEHNNIEKSCLVLGQGADLEEKINTKIEEKINEGYKIIDIKYSTEYIPGMRNSQGGIVINHYALLLLKKK